MVSPPQKSARGPGEAGVTGLLTSPRLPGLWLIERPVCQRKWAPAIKALMSSSTLVNFTAFTEALERGGGVVPRILLPGGLALQRS